MPRLASLIFTVASLVAGGAAAQLDLERRGRTLLDDMCGACHATGRTGQSPHVAAPAFRHLDRRLDLDGFVQQLRDGLISSHKDMPAFRFSHEDARAVVAYLRTIQAP
jgi:mono/diheme cytochrome c family protein